MKRFNFYLKYAWRSIVRGRGLSAFVVVCVAVGVSTLVALQSLTTSIQNTLTGDIQARAGGDVVAHVNFNNNYQLTLSPRVQTLLNNLKSQGEVTAWTGINTHTIQITGYFNVPPTIYIVDPAFFPLYGQIPLVEPAGGNFKELLSQPDSIIISKSLWRANNYRLGQEIEVSGVTDFTSPGTDAVPLKIVGVMDPAIPGVNFDTGLFTGFGMVSQASASAFLSTAEVTPTTFFIKTPPGANEQAITGQLLNFNRNTNASFPFFSKVQTATDVLGESSKELAPLEEILVYTGLLTILIGGMGVVNTMLVVVGQRTGEIATIKALGLKGRQALTIFTLEVLILGGLGSLAGAGFGVGLGYGLKGVAEGLFGRPLEWGLYPGPIVTGLLVGTLASVLFGFLPAYAAARVAPAVVLRQSQNSGLPRIGNLPALAVIFSTTILGGVMAGALVGELALGLAIAFVLLLVVMVLVAFMYLVIYLASRLPAPLGPDFKMALRNFDRHRSRTASTLLVITVSLFFISLIGIVSDSVKSTLQNTFSFDLGFNAAAVDVFGNQDNELEARFRQELPGLQQIFMSNDIQAMLLSVNRAPLNSEAALQDSNCGQFITSSRFGGSGSRLRPFIQLSGRTIPPTGPSISPNGPQEVVSGRTFTPADADKRVLVVGQDEARCYGIRVGDVVTMRLRSNNLGGVQANGINGPVDLQVIGIVTRGTAGTNFEQGFVAPFSLVDMAGAQFSIFFMRIEPSQVKADLTRVQNFLLYKDFVFDFTGLVDTFTGLLNQALAFPLLLSLLSLLSGSLLIANNVALAVLERRSEVGVLKAIGAKRRRVLAILLWESSILGFLGSVLGIGGSLAVATVLPGLVKNANRNLNLLIYWSPISAVLILGLGIGLAAAGTLLSAWRAVRERPLVVLRYE